MHATHEQCGRVFHFAGDLQLDRACFNRMRRNPTEILSAKYGQRKMQKHQQQMQGAYGKLYFQWPVLAHEYQYVRICGRLRSHSG